MPSNLSTTSFLGSTRNPWSYQKVEQVDRDISTAWLTLEDITQQLNLFDDESQDAYLTGLELAARMAVEDYLGMSILPVQYKAYYGATNNSMGMQTSLDLPEISQDTNVTTGVTVNSVKYYNMETPPVLTTITNTEYFYDPTGNKIVINSLPNDINTFMTNPVVVLYQLNANPIGTYPVIKQAGLLILTHLYNNRSDTSTDRLKQIPFGAQTLLRPYKPLVL
jgi:hypothetical protein|tara:strand:+ start:578 stop:1243 length:666 start_codon:yes stop_codon:yes gene_type:complete